MRAKTIFTFITIGMLAMVVMTGCSGSKTTTVVQQVVQGSSPVIQSLSVQGLPSSAGGTITASVVAVSEQGLGLTYTWTAYNGWSVSSGASMSIATIKAPDTYAASGTVTVQVSDTNGRYALVPIPVSTVGDNAPVITNLSASLNPAPRDGIIVVAVNATDPLGNALKYAWTGSAGWPVTGYGVTATVTAPNAYNAGGYITVTVSDNYGMAVTASIAVSTIVDNPPVISGFNVSPNPVIKGGTTAISVTATDPYNNTLLYSWQASSGWTVATGKGTSAITVTAPTQYGVSGTVTVTVDDGYGGTASLLIPVSTIGNSAPVINGFSTSPNPVVQGGLMAIAVTAADPDGDTLSYAWQASNGWTISTGKGTSGVTVTAPAQYGVSGTVTVTVDDGQGDTASLSIPVSTYFEFFPTITISPNPVITSTTFTCNGYTPINDSLIFNWNVDGIPLTTATGNNAFWSSPGIPGSYTVNVAVSDGNGSSVATGTSLMSVVSNSPWPEFGEGMQSTRLSAALSATPTTGALEWSYTTGNKVISSAAIGADGTIYIGSVDHNLYALTPTGALEWSYTTGGVVNSSPAIGADGTVYVGSYDNKLYAINPNGKLKWSYTTGSMIYSSPAIGADGTVYVGSVDDNLYALTPTGALEWSYTTGGAVNSSPAIGADGTIFVGSANYLYALTPTGALKWTYQTGGTNDAPAIGADGTIYITNGSSTIYAINPDGSLKWSYLVFGVGGVLNDALAIGTNGTIYAGSSGAGVNGLYAINPDGSLDWSYTTVGGVQDSPAIGADGTIYIADMYNVYAITPTDLREWEYPVPNPGPTVPSCPAIGADGTIYVGVLNSLYALH